MQGLHITSTSLTWVPYLSVSDCDEQGMDCNKNYGALVDIVALLEKRYNMTIHSYKDPNNDWGVYPKNGSHDYTGEWGGVMGDVSKLSIFKSNLILYSFFACLLGYTR